MIILAEYQRLTWWCNYALLQNGWSRKKKPFFLFQCSLILSSLFFFINAYNTSWLLCYYYFFVYCGELWCSMWWALVFNVVNFCAQCGEYYQFLAKTSNLLERSFPPNIWTLPGNEIMDWLPTFFVVTFVLIIRS